MISHDWSLANRKGKDGLTILESVGTQGRGE